MNRYRSTSVSNDAGVPEQELGLGYDERRLGSEPRLSLNQRDGGPDRVERVSGREQTEGVARV